MNSRLASLRTRLLQVPLWKRWTAAGGAILFAVGLAAFICWTSLEPDYSKTWFSVEFTTNNTAHPMHLSLPGKDQGRFDLLMVENCSSEPLSILAFSSRPKVAGLTGDQIMSTWAQWVATARQGIIVPPKSAWVMNPGDLGKLPALHGHTWICIFFSAARASGSALPATVLPATFGGRFRVHYCLSQLPEAQVAAPQVHRQNLTQLLQAEVDESDKTIRPFEIRDLSNQNGLTPSELR